jgi:indolepyruvate ferredoxin oxidoreductase beta subunit
MVNEYNILIASVGGQGGVTLARILSQAAMAQGLNVRVGETLGMAQRGGAVQSHVRVGDAVHGPLIPHGKTDVLLGLEPTESLRNPDYLGSRTRAIVSTAFIHPTPITLGDETPPDLSTVISALRGITSEVYAFDARRVAASVGAPASLNVVILGAYSALGDAVLSEASMKSALVELTPRRFLEQNARAYEAGQREIKAMRTPS